MDSRDAIKKQFLKEYEKGDFQSITVKGLCAAAPVARTTFYSYYSNTDDVLREIEDEILGGLDEVTWEVSGGDLPDMDFTLFMDAVEQYIKNNWSVIRALLVTQPDHRFIRKWKDAIIRNFGKRYPERKGAKNFGAAAEIAASSLISSYTYWMEHPDTASPDEVKPFFKKTLEELVKML